jgi:hypothetical protein
VKDPLDVDSWIGFIQQIAHWFYELPVGTRVPSPINEMEEQPPIKLPAEKAVSIAVMVHSR